MKSDLSTLAVSETPTNTTEARPTRIPTLIVKNKASTVVTEEHKFTTVIEAVVSMVATPGMCFCHTVMTSGAYTNETALLSALTVLGFSQIVRTIGRIACA